MHQGFYHIRRSSSAHGMLIFNIGFRDRLFLVVCAFARVLFTSRFRRNTSSIFTPVKRKRPQDGQPHQRCVKGDLGFSPTSRNRAVFSPEKIARFAERVPHGIACNSLVAFCSCIYFSRCHFVLNIRSAFWQWAKKRAHDHKKLLDASKKLWYILCE